jgi:hypothetical protein
VSALAPAPVRLPAEPEIEFPSTVIARIIESYMRQSASTPAQVALTCRVSAKFVTNILTDPHRTVSELMVDKLLLGMDRTDEWHTTLAPFWQSA